MIYPKRLSKRQIISKVIIGAPKRITSECVLSLWNRGLVDFVRDSFEEAVESICSGEKVVVLGEKFRVSSEDSNYMLKSLWERFVKIDGTPNLRRVIEEGTKDEKLFLKPRLSKSLTERLSLWPYSLAKPVVEGSDVEKPPLGFYWVGSDKHVRAVEFMRSTDGAILTTQKGQDELEGGKFYGRNLRVEIKSGKEKYSVDLTNLPLFSVSDPRHYSGWIDFSGSCSCKDMSYRSRQHNKWAQNIMLFCKHIALSYFTAIKEARQKGNLRVDINPFPLANRDMLRFLDNAANNTLVLEPPRGSRSYSELRTLNKTELSQLMGAETVRSGYDNRWFHWRQKFKVE